MDDEQTLPEPAASEVAPSETDQAIDAWFNEHFCNAPPARDTEVFNHCQRAKEELKRRLAAL